MKHRLGQLGDARVRVFAAAGIAVVLAVVGWAVLVRPARGPHSGPPVQALGVLARQPSDRTATGAAAGAPLESLVAALLAGNAHLEGYALPEAQVARLAHETAQVLVALADETSGTFEDVALRKQLRLPRGLSSGTDAHRHTYWKDTTDYFRSVDVDMTGAVVLVRNSKNRALAGPRVGREMVVRVSAADEAPSEKPVYEVVFSGIARSGTNRGKPVRFGVLMIQDAPDGSWRTCGVSHYDVPNSGESRPIIPVAYPAK